MASFSVINGIGIWDLFALRLLHEPKLRLLFTNALIFILLASLLTWKLGPERKGTHTRFSELTPLEKTSLLVTLMIQLVVSVVIWSYWPRP